MGQADPFTLLSPEIRRAAETMGLGEATPPQKEAIPAILEGRDVLLIAPTGMGKTEAALLPVLQGILRRKEREGISAIYITPLRALNRDMVERLERWAHLLDFTVEVRHGDTAARDRRRQAIKPPDLLVTTPETLQAILPGSRMQGHLASVGWVVVDEVHELAGERRGVQLMVGLERLERITRRGLQRIGLSATVGNPSEVAAFLGGRRGPVGAIEVKAPKAYAYSVELPTPVPDDHETARRLYISPEAAASLNRLEEWVDAHQRVLIFVNSRGNAEILGSRFGMVRKDIGVHHGSLPREERVRVEADFKTGQLKALVCIAADEPIVTANGVKPAKDVGPVDRILSFDLQSRNTIFSNVTQKFTRVSSNLLHIKHELGLLRITPNHPVLCLGPQGFVWKLAQDLTVGDALVTAGRLEGSDIPIHSLIDYPNLFVRNTVLRALGHGPPLINPKRRVTRFLKLKSALGGSDLLNLTEFCTTQGSYTFPAWVDPKLGYLLGFLKSDGDRHMRFFNTDPKKIKQIESFLSELYPGTHKAIAPISRQGFPSAKPLIILQAASKVLSNVLTNLWQTLPLREEVVSGVLAAYLDGDGCIVVKDNSRIEQMQFVTFNPINREYLLFCLLALGLKPKLWKANGDWGEGFSVSVVYSDDKSRLFGLVKGLSLKVTQAKALNFGRKPKTYYGLGSFLRNLRKNQRISSYRLWQIMGYSTRYESRSRGITINTLKRLNQYLGSPIIDDLVSGKFGISQVRSIEAIEGAVDVVNFEVQHTQAYAVTGVITHNCTSTLELGIDVGAVDLVLQYMSPRRVTSLIQRVGRSGHAIGRESRGVTIAVSPEDALEGVAVTLGAQEGRLEPLTIHRDALDVVAHQVLGIALDHGGRVAESMVLELVRGAEPYRTLGAEALGRVVDFLVDLKLLRREGEEVVVGRRGRDHYYLNLSMIRDERRYPAIDLTTQQAVGILGEEFMIIRARQGVNFLVKGRPWKIQRIASDGRVYVTPVEDPTAMLPGWDGEMLPVSFELAQRLVALRLRIGDGLREGTQEEVSAALRAEWPANPHALNQLVAQTAAHLATGAPLPTESLVLVESFGRYLIIHAPFGEVVNDTLGDFIEDHLAKDHLVRFWWADAQRILLELTVPSDELDVEALVTRAVRVGPEETEARLKAILEEHFPLGFYMKFVAERFGALPRGIMISADDMNALQLRFKGTPIEEEALREAHLLHLDFPRVRRVVEGLRTGAIRLAFHRSLERPTPLGYPILQRFVEAPELFAPDAASDANLDRMRDHLETELVSLLCIRCGRVVVDTNAKVMGERPVCPACGEGLLGILPFFHAPVVEAFGKKRRREPLGPEEQKALVKLRQSADLVLSHGKRAVVALLVYGIGPQTAAKILAKEHEEERDFYRDLLEAKLRFITTKPYWEKEGGGLRPRATW